MGEGKEYLARRRLSTNVSKVKLSECVTPNVPAQDDAALWCDEKYYNMLYMNTKREEPYWSCPAPTPSPSPSPSPSPPPPSPTPKEPAPAPAPKEPAPAPAPKEPEVPDWYCKKDDKPDPYDTFGHLRRAKQKCGHCHSRFMGPWVWVMIALIIEAILTCVVMKITCERRRLGKVTTGRWVPRKKTPAVYEPGKYRKGSIKAGSYEPFVWKSGRFRYIKPKKITFAKLQITDRARRKWVTYLTHTLPKRLKKNFSKYKAKTPENHGLHTVIILGKIMHYQEKRFFHSSSRVRRRHRKNINVLHMYNHISYIRSQFIIMG